MSSVKTNYLLQLANVSAGLFFPLITFPYTCRVVGVDGIGLVSWFDSIVAYIVLFVNLGIPMYAIRETARVRNNAAELDKTSAEIFALHSLLSLFGVVAVAVILLTVGEVREHTTVFLIVSSTLFFNILGCEWFFAGTEDFKYITIRGLVVKVVSVALLFLLVRSSDDLVLYAIYTVAGCLGGNIFNFFRIRRKAPSVAARWRGLNLKRHIRPALETFAFSLVVSIYLRLNQVILGAVESAAAVGFYAAATRLLTAFKALPKVLGDIMLPRMSNLVANGDEDEVRHMLQKSYDFTLFTTIPIVIFLIVAAPHIICLFCGHEFLPAVLASQIVAPVMFFSSVTNVIGLQTFYAHGHMNIVSKTCAIGAVGDLVACLVLIPHFSFNGAAAAYLFAEILVLVAQLIMGWKYIPFRFFTRRHWSLALAGVAMVAASVAAHKAQWANDFVAIVAIGAVGFATYFATLLLMRDPLIREGQQMLRGLLRRRKPSE